MASDDTSRSSSKEDIPLYLSYVGVTVSHDNYTSLNDISDAINRGECTPIDVQENIARIYTVDQIRTIASYAGETATFAVRSVNGVMGVNSAYMRAEKLFEASKEDKIDLGAAVLTADHDHVFTQFSYFGIPSEWGGDAKKLWGRITDKQSSTRRDFRNPFKTPGSLHPTLDSAKIDGERITLVYSQLRVLHKTKHSTNDIAGLFIARIPIVVSFLFDLGIVEISLPPFADVPMGYHGSALSLIHI